MATRIPTLTLYTNDTYPLFNFTVSKSDGTAQDLSGVSVKCLILLQGNSSPLFTGSNQDCTVISAATGICRYELPSAITDPGIYTGQLLLDFGASNVQRTQRFELKVLTGVPTS